MARFYPANAIFIRVLVGSQERRSSKLTVTDPTREDGLLEPDFRVPSKCGPGIFVSR
jgi:hypothetical protein